MVACMHGLERREISLFLLLFFPLSTLHVTALNSSDSLFYLGNLLWVELSMESLA
ncbi:hypothetical protein BDZ91DRAFT_731059 [Kalaharituber pfeilii]|nr:hypothetical protein BDZ91DRAFT_731059 [Kalaharituber pfeilii]